MLEPDSPHDDIRDRLAGVEVQTKTMSDEQRQQIQELEREYGDILTKQPSCTDKVTIDIDTGDH